MSNPLTSSEFRRLLDLRLREVSEAKYKELQENMIDRLYRTVESTSAWEEFYSIGAVPDVPEFDGKLTTVGQSPGYLYKIEPKEYAVMMEAERKLLDDNKYGVLKDRAGSLMTAAVRTREKLAVRPFANAFSSAFDFVTSEEGVALCSSSHTTKSGTSTATGFDNAGSSALSPTSIAATRILMRQLRNDISERIDISDNLALIVPDNLADRANEIIGTPFGLDTTENNKNMQAGRYEIIPWMRLDDYDSNNWFMVDKDAMKRDLLWINRVAPESKNTVDFDTYVLKQAIYFRCGNGPKDWRWIYGHAVS